MVDVIKVVDDLLASGIERTQSHTLVSIPVLLILGSACTSASFLSNI